MPRGAGGRTSPVGRRTRDGSFRALHRVRRQRCARCMAWPGRPSEVRRDTSLASAGPHAAARGRAPDETLIAVPHCADPRNLIYGSRRWRWRDRCHLIFENGSPARTRAATRRGTRSRSFSRSAARRRLVRRYRETRSVDPSPHGGGKPRKMTPRGEKVLRVLIEERPDATIPEFVRLLAERAKLTLSTSTMGRELARLGLSRK